MYDLLSDLCVVEGASFVAAPTCALHLRQMGAEVIRFDPIGGGPDFTRWPKAANGASLYWEGLNKGKKSVALNLSSPEGRELAQALAAAAGLFVTNYPASGFLSHERLAARRPDMITVRVMGWADGRNAVDYTVNAAFGIPTMTGPETLGREPVNQVLPTWDLTTGLYAAFALLAAERRRRAGGGGGEVRVPLGDMAIASLASLGMVAEATAARADRPRHGNHIFGAFGRDFATLDGRRLMVAAISQKQWAGLLKSLGIEAEVAALEAALGVSFAIDEGLRFVHRDALCAIVAPAIAGLRLDDVGRRFDAGGVTWGPYRGMAEALDEDTRLSADNPMLSQVDHLSGLSYLTPGAPATLPGVSRSEPSRAPRLGEHTEEVLARMLGMTDTQIGRLLEKGVVSKA